MIFDQIWREEWKRDRLQRSYDKDINKLVKVQKFKDAANLREEAAHFVNEADQDLDCLRSRRLVKKAIRLQIPRPDFKDETSWTQWGEYGYVLTDKGYDELRSRIMKFQSERLEHRMRWVKLVLIPLGTFIIGILGTYFTMKRNSDQQSKTQTETHQQDHKADQPRPH
jgi:hypothetical protein